MPYLEGARAAAEAGYVSGGASRNLDWVRPHTDLDGVDDVTALLLADPQTSGGLLVAGEVEGGTVIGNSPARRPRSPRDDHGISRPSDHRPVITQRSLAEAQCRG